MKTSQIERGIRLAFRDHAMPSGMLTYDGATRTHDEHGNALGRRFQRPMQTHDGRTVDSTGAFLVGELERLDPTMHAPLAAVSWQRDIDLRTDVTLADDISSFTLSTFASQGGLGAGNGVGNGKSWAGKRADQVATVGIDIAKITHPLTIWSNEIAFTIMELESAAKLGRPIDEQKFEGVRLKNQMDTDEQVYIGDTSLGVTGLINNASVYDTNVPNGASGFSTWASKTPDEILADVNSALTTVWANSAWAVLPSKILIPPAQYGLISTQKVSLAGNVSTLKYILENNITTTRGGGTLEIEPLKWALGAGNAKYGQTGQTDRMIVYTQDRERVRFPMTEMGRTPMQYDGIWQKCTYYQKLGVVEIVYPQTLGYFDGI